MAIKILFLPISLHPLKYLFFILFFKPKSMGQVFIIKWKRTIFRSTQLFLQLFIDVVFILLSTKRILTHFIRSDSIFVPLIVSTCWRKWTIHWILTNAYINRCIGSTEWQRHNEVGISMWGGERLSLEKLLEFLSAMNLMVVDGHASNDFW